MRSMLLCTNALWVAKALYKFPVLSLLLIIAVAAVAEAVERQQYSTSVMQMKSLCLTFLKVIVAEDHRRVHLTQNGPETK